MKKTLRSFVLVPVLLVTVLVSAFFSKQPWFRRRHWMEWLIRLKLLD